MEIADSIIIRIIEALDMDIQVTSWHLLRKFLTSSRV